MDPIQISVPTSPNFNDTSLEQAQTNTYFAATKQSADLNSALQADYATKFHNWALNVLAGRVDNSNPPAPPKTYIVDYFSDPTTGPGTEGAYSNTVVKWAYPAQLGPFLPSLPIPTPPPVAAPNWFSAVGGTIRNSPPGDTTPAGARVTAPDGSVWEKKSNKTPFGLAVWYEKVA